MVKHFLCMNSHIIPRKWYDIRPWTEYRNPIISEIINQELDEVVKKNIEGAESHYRKTGYGRFEITSVECQEIDPTDTDYLIFRKHYVEFFDPVDDARYLAERAEWDAEHYEWLTKFNKGYNTK